MAELPIPEKVKKLWGVWNLRGGILLSLFIQIFLMLFASRRQRSRSSLLRIFIWLAYLLADWLAAVCIGLITKTQIDSCNGKADDHILAFWASFLLIHLGGPDTITSFALEDNEFWVRHVIGLILQVLVAAYSLFLTLPNNKLWFPTLLIFVVGTIKFGERTFALYLASSDHFAETILPKPEPGPDYEEAIDVYTQNRAVSVRTRPDQKKTTTPNVANFPKEDEVLEDEKEYSLDEKITLLAEAHDNFKSFKGLIVGLLLSSKERESSRKSFLKRKPKEAFLLIEYELSFMYQVLHTKVVVVRRKIGYILRILSLFFTVGALMVFFIVEKHKFGRFDVVLSYALLFGALVIDFFSVIHLIFSEWTLIAPDKNWWRTSVANIALRGKRWSGTVSQYDMIKYCQDERTVLVSCVYKLAVYLCIIRGILDRVKLWLYSTTATVDTSLKTFIFEELRTKANTANSLRGAMEACSQRGDWALLETSNYIKLKWSVGEFQYAESLLLWHIATELCYSESPSLWENQSKKLCKLLSDYMFSLSVKQGSMLAPVLGNWHIVFQDTCAEAKRFFHKHQLVSHSESCKKIIDTKTNLRPAAVKGSKSKSVLFDASKLAKDLQSLGTGQWRLMSRVWVELLSYAAINCRPIVHAQQPSKGGELLTFTWLLMNHLGLGTQFYEQELQDGTKLVAVK
ncbi:uncharacterized protein LOC133794184 [Humulus lupulus]|uniref:uncharacterized protein LOC133794184 n=1 Tax=Humulus lupulus TaxID=3486 RepID=UPI002B40DB1C|nr:uncharacterized protein LOC133794184 [Humulus lupulus]